MSTSADPLGGSRRVALVRARRQLERRSELLADAGLALHALELLAEVAADGLGAEASPPTGRMVLRVASSIAMARAA